MQEQNKINCHAESKFSEGRRVSVANPARKLWQNHVFDTTRIISSISASSHRQVVTLPETKSDHGETSPVARFRNKFGMTFDFCRLMRGCRDKQKSRLGFHPNNIDLRRVEPSHVGCNLLHQKSKNVGCAHLRTAKNFAGRRKVAFTLAEVLITLGIIGVVAALTLPILMGNYKKIEYGSKLKKFNSTMQQAILMSEQDNGAAGEWTKDGGIEGDIKDEEGNADYKANAQVTEKFINTYLKPYIKIISINSLSKGEYGSQFGESYMVFEDGSYLYLHNGNCVDFLYDVNGPKLPNVIGRDIFHYLLCPNEKCSAHTWYTGKCGKFTFNGMKSANREQALEKCKNNARLCTELLEMDAYEFKKDYPYKL